MAISTQTIEKIFQQEKNPDGFFLELGNVVLEEFTDIKLIGDIERPEGRDTYEALKEYLKTVLEYFDRFPLHIFENEDGHYRAVMSLYFVWTGIFLYGEEQGHELWPHIFQGLGYGHDPNLSWQCGRLFMKCLRENDLESFDNVSSGNVYVTRILLHGLIPERYIERFVREFLLESLSEPGGFHKTGHALIEDWITQKYLVPKPIERFLRYGWPVNVQLVERFLDMAREWDEGNYSHWRRWGLPKYMVEAFIRCAQGNHNKIIKKGKGSKTGERAFLVFDYANQTQPIIVLPSHILDEEGEIEISYKRVGEQATETKSLRASTQLVGESLYSEQQELQVGPSEYWEITVGNNMQRVHYNYPEGESGNKVPLYLFSSNSGKAIKFGSDSRIPEEIIVLYPEDAILELSGGTFLSEPIALQGKWRGWTCAFCTLDEKGAFHYYGPDRFFTTYIEERLPFRRFDEQEIQPSLFSQHKAPHWLKCSDEIPIFFDPKGLHIYFSNQSYRIWRRGVGGLRRLDLPLERLETIPFRLSDAKKKENGRMIPVPWVDDMEPGVYEVYLRGPIGVEDFKMPFIYLPILRCERALSEERMPVVKEFLLEFSEMVPMLTFEGTEILIDSENRKARVFLKEDRADAYCGLKIFHDTAMPITLLLERSEIRWVRHSESGLYDWPYWRARPEIIPIQRLNEIRDSRALIEIDPAPLATFREGPKVLPSGRLRIVFEGRKNENAPMDSLMSYEASKFKRRFRTIWLIELKQFSDQMMDLQSYQRADISIDCGGPEKDIPLFTLLRYPEYENFRLLSPKVTENAEKLQITWDERPNEPRKNRALKVYPLGQPDRSTYVPIADGQKPPIGISLERAEEAQQWVAEIDIRHGRFQTSRFHEIPSIAQTRWFRIPKNWYDWLEWESCSIDECLSYFGGDENTLSTIDSQAMPWSYFLLVFHRGNGQRVCKELRNLLGEKILNLALPFSKGSKWEIKSDSKTCLRLLVISSSVDPTEAGLRCFGDCSPIQWCYIPKQIQMELQMEQSSRFLGKAGTVWTLLRTPKDKEPLLASETEGILEIAYWVEDAVDEGKNGFLQACMPLEKLWDIPSNFYLLEKIKVRDAIFVRERGKSKFGKILSTLEIDKAANDYAFDLVNRWEKWSSYPDVSPLFRRMIKGRLDFSQIGVLTGSLAFISRLMAVGREASVFRMKTDGSPATKSMDSLVIDTYEFVKEFLPRAFLRDLILSELLIGWYWQKRLWPIKT